MSRPQAASTIHLGTFFKTDQRVSMLTVPRPRSGESTGNQLNVDVVRGLPFYGMTA